MPTDRKPKAASEGRSDSQILASTTATVPEAGRLLSLSRNGAYAAARRGDIPTLKLGKKLVVPTAALREMLGVNLPQPAMPCGEGCDDAR